MASCRLYHQMAMPRPTRRLEKDQSQTQQLSVILISTGQYPALVHAEFVPSQVHQGACIQSVSMPASQNVTVLSPFLRKLDYDSYSKLVLRQAPPLPAVPQPPNGHSLAFHILEGVCLLPFIHEIVPPAQLPAKAMCLPVASKPFKACPDGIRSAAPQP